jgi:acetyl esterase/lipase
MAVALTPLGWATVNIEYTRGHGSHGSAAADVEAAAQWINDNAATYQLDAERIVAIGHSAGGYLALLLAERGSTISAAVPLATVSSLTAISESRPDDDPVALLLGATRSEAPRLWDQAELTGEPGVPVHMLHGDKDDIVPADHSNAYASLGGVDTTATIVEGIGHMDLIDTCGDSWQGLVATLERFRA